MISVTIIAVGKPPKGWAKEAQQEYLNRLKGQMQVEWRWLRDDAALLTAVSQCKEPLWALDETGKLPTSPEFSKILLGAGAKFTLIIGGAAGLPKKIKTSLPLISLSRLTFPHQIAHLVLVEQLYRALTIEQGHPYHK